MFSVAEDAGVATVTLERPPYNTLDPEFAGRLAEAFTTLAARPDVCVLHVRSAARSFCAGPTLELLRRWHEAGEGAAAEIATLDDLNRTIAELPAITLAEVGGAAVGAGLGFALAFDLRIAAEEAKFGVPEAPVGAIPVGGTLRRLAAVAGPAAALRLFVTAELVGGGEASRLGLVERVVPRAQLPAQARRLAARIRGFPKATLLAAKAEIFKGTLESEAGALKTLLEDPQARARFGAFLDARRDG